jgi:hypothetical protein
MHGIIDDCGDVKRDGGKGREEDVDDQHEVSGLGSCSFPLPCQQRLLSRPGFDGIQSCRDREGLEEIRRSFSGDYVIVIRFVSAFTASTAATDCYFLVSSRLSLSLALVFITPSHITRPKVARSHERHPFSTGCEIPEVSRGRGFESRRSTHGANADADARPR